MWGGSCGGVTYAVYLLLLYIYIYIFVLYACTVHSYMWMTPGARGISPHIFWSSINGIYIYIATRFIAIVSSGFALQAGNICHLFIAYRQNIQLNCHSGMFLSSVIYFDHFLALWFPQSDEVLQYPLSFDVFAILCCSNGCANFGWIFIWLHTCCLYSRGNPDFIYININIFSILRNI